MAPFDFQPLVLSLEVALCALLLVLFAGTLAARLMCGPPFPGKDLIEGTFLLPLVLPPVVTGFVLLVLLGRHGWVGVPLRHWLGIQLIFTPAAAVLASAVVAFPLMYGSMKAAFSNLDPQLEDVAGSLGATPWRVFWSVTLPLAWPGLLAGTLLAFARALGEFGATIMVAGDIPGRTTTVPTAIYFASESGDLRLAGIYAAVIGVVNLGLIVVVNGFVRRVAARRRGWRA